MLQRRGDADLLEEPLGADGGGELLAQHLDRDVAIVPHVAREVHGGHAAAPELALDLVAARERRRESLGERRSAPDARALRRRAARGSRRRRGRARRGATRPRGAARRRHRTRRRRRRRAAPARTRARRRARPRCAPAIRRHRRREPAIFASCGVVVTARARGGATCARWPTRDRPSPWTRRATAAASGMLSPAK